MLNEKPAERLEYCEVFEKYTHLHPLHCTLLDLQNHAENLGLHTVRNVDRDTCLQFIMSTEIEQHLGKTRPTVVANFPATQAALARKCRDNSALAERFEVYVKGMELANGFYELTDFTEQYDRFQQELEKRQMLNLLQHPLDNRFLDALQAGLPDCAGVAVGIDRLLMLIAKVPKIQDVLTFSIEYA
jgi:lysyl-tRNA synthetase class 2